MPARSVSPAIQAASRDIQAGLRQLIRGFRRLAMVTLKQTTAAGTPTKRTVSPGRRIQGRYIGLMRNLPAKDKAKVRAVRAKKGVEAAIKMARDLRRPR